MDDVSRLLPAYAPDCYLCPGNPRISGARNPAYTGIYVFDNDHPCVAPSALRHETQSSDATASLSLGRSGPAARPRYFIDPVGAYSLFTPRIG